MLARDARAAQEGGRRPRAGGGGGGAEGAVRTRPPGCGRGHRCRAGGDRRGGGVGSGGAFLQLRVPRARRPRPRGQRRPHILPRGPCAGRGRWSWQRSHGGDHPGAPSPVHARHPLRPPLCAARAVARSPQAHPAGVPVQSRGGVQRLGLPGRLRGGRRLRPPADQAIRRLHGRVQVRPHQRAPRGVPRQGARGRRHVLRRDCEPGQGGGGAGVRRRGVVRHGHGGHEELREEPRRAGRRGSRSGVGGLSCTSGARHAAGNRPQWTARSSCIGALDGSLHISNSSLHLTAQLSRRLLTILQLVPTLSLRVRPGISDDKVFSTSPLPEGADARPLERITTKLIPDP
mmetsp:Transcript_27794/g.94865  ORF Transcript_27794/g.94865 Transcript_27794/m.94865 type:complete len:345 (+) Transcript_27794:655-1689(+)